MDIYEKFEKYVRLKKQNLNFFFNKEKNNFNVLKYMK